MVLLKSMETVFDRGQLSFVPTGSGSGFVVKVLRAEVLQMKLLDNALLHCLDTEVS